MKHLLNYYREQTLNNGDRVRLELYREHPDDWLPDPLTREIGDVLAGLHLDIEGGMDDIDTPIVKTSLTFSVVDAPEKQTYWTAPKTGNWEEFYTTSATGWKVVLLGKKPNAAQFTPMWTGYVTPDSYTETLQYHGVVTITARDGIGHLQDFDFDAVGNSEGMITPRELLTLAWEKAQIPMTLEWRGMADSNIWPQTGGVDAIDTYVNVSAFEGKTWYDAVTETLYSLGLVLRYVGKNIIAVCPLRRMPAQTEENMNDLRAITPRFAAYGTRELVPAVREISEEVQYDLPQDGVSMPIIRKEDFAPNVSLTKEAFYASANGSVLYAQMPVHPVANTDAKGWGNITTNTLFFNPFTSAQVDTSDKSIQEQTFLLANTTSEGQSWYGCSIQCANLVLNFEQGVLLTKSGRIVILDYAGATIDQIDESSLRVAIKLTVGNAEYFYNGEKFTTKYKTVQVLFKDSVTASLPINMNIEGAGVLQVFFLSVKVAQRYNPLEPLYLGLKALKIDVPEQVSMMEKNTVRTIYEETNNVRVSRSPEFGPAYDLVAIPGLIRNGIFRKEGDIYKTAEEWVWQYEGGDAVQLAVLIHQQLLCYHSKPNNVLTGDIVNADMLNPRVVWTWKGAEHLLLSGSYNFLTSRLEGAVLREFVRYEDMW